MKTIHIITYGKNQKPVKPHWWNRGKSTFTIDAEKRLPEFPDTVDTTIGTEPSVLHFFENDIATTFFLVTTYTTLLNWTKNHKEDELYIYIRSNTGCIRSVYAGNKIKWFFESQSFSTEIHHMELSRRNLT